MIGLAETVKLSEPAENCARCYPRQTRRPGLRV